MLAASIELSSGVGAPGGQATITGVMRTEGATVIGAMVDLTAPDGISIGANARGRPSCVSYCNQDYEPIVSLADASSAEFDPIGGPAKACAAQNFVFLPVGCSPGVNCTGVRYLEIILALYESFPDGGTLFTCTVDIADDLELGTYPVVCSGPQASNPEGLPVPATCTDGTLQIGCPGDCDGDAHVSIHEVVRGFAIMTSAMSTAECRAFDTDADDALEIAEFVRGYRSLLHGCAGE
jgi:hypothetical protein